MEDKVEAQGGEPLGTLLRTDDTVVFWGIRIALIISCATMRSSDKLF